MVDMTLRSIGAIGASAKSVKPEPQHKTPNGTSFGQWLSQSIKDVGQLQENADIAAIQLATGQNKDIHGAMIKMQKAEIATNLMMTVRNKVISAYDEIKRMQF